VHNKEKDSIFCNFVENIKKNMLCYLSHPQFVNKISLARYRDLKKKSSWLF